MRKKRYLFLHKHTFIRVLLIVVIAFLFVSGGIILWIATLKIPDLQSFQDKVLAGSTKIYDRTGQTVLFDLNKDVRQQVVPFDQISPYVKQATISIEDDKFYQHKGIELTSIARAILADLTTFKFSQGGSTITQQVIKNSLLTTDKTISRKIKEWVLALKLERVMSKDDILNLYLNGTSYGGNYYGVEEASQNFFATSSANLDIAQSAYLAALPQAPSLYSPFGSHRDLLDARKNLVLSKMKELGYITDTQYSEAKAEAVVFKAQELHNIKAPHFVMYIRDYLIQKYGEDVVSNGNLKVITTLDYDMQQKAEDVVKQYALANEKKFNATNAALVAVDPTNGQILTMVGSRDYFDKKIDGNFNVALAHRQPGSSFKPFAYATAFNKGYTPDTVLFDLPTQFSTTCDAHGKPIGATGSCYSPQNYDGQFLGPISLRNALAQSRNIPSVKLLYLAGIKDTIQTAQDMGITSLTNPNQYGLTLVLGGGEVSPLEMTSAYGVFANNGVRNPATGILKITDRSGKTLEEFTATPSQVIPMQSAMLINDILHDNTARLPLNGVGSATDFPDREVALKTGTTNDYRDVWTVGYTPHIAVGAWAGNNNNSPMIHKTSGLIIAPLWRAFMNEILPSVPTESFARPDPIDPTLKPALRGIWQGNQTYVIDSSSGKLATDLTPPELRKETALPNVHSILYWVDKNDPKGPPPSNPSADPQFTLWETPIQAWVASHQAQVGSTTPPTQSDDVHTQQAAPIVIITGPTNGVSFNKGDKITVETNHQSQFPLKKMDFLVNGTSIGTATEEPFSISFTTDQIANLGPSNTIQAIAYDPYDNKGSSATVTFSVK